MSLNELAEYYPQRLQARRRNFKRSALKAAMRTQKTLKATMRRTRSKTLAFARAQYYPATAYGDMRLAIARNEDIFIVSTILLAVLMFGVTTTALQFLLTFLGTATAVADLTHFSGGLLMLITFAVPAVLCMWVAAFLINMFSISLMEGATRKVNRSVRLTARRSLRFASRTANGWYLLSACLAIVPIALLLAMTFYMQVANLSKTDAMAVAPVFLGACVLWVIYVLANFSLVPTVALFEPQLPLMKVLGRSRQLVQRRGRIFSLVAYVLAAAVIAVVYLIASLIQYALHIDKAALVSLGSLAAILVGHGLMVMLYRKRKLARKN